jgi:nucleoside-diphosphate-sugar epimerase
MDLARALIIGCGCRGQELARALKQQGHQVRGTSRTGNRLDQIEDAGAEAVIADPYRLATVTPLLEGVSVVVWPMGSATGTADQIDAVHTTRLETLLTKLVDSGVRGLVYEATGSVRGDVLRQGAAQVRKSGEWFRMPVEVVEHDPADHDGWTAAMTAAVGRILDV